MNGWSGLPTGRGYPSGGKSLYFTIRGELDSAIGGVCLTSIRPGRSREVDPLTVTQRLQREGRWKDIEPQRDEMMKLARKQFKDKPSRQRWVYSELDRMYPPLSGEKPPLAGSGEDGTPKKIGISSPSSGPEFTDVDGAKPLTAENRKSYSSDGQIQGLGDVPAAWGDLPSNAAIGVEVAWVQANRLRIVSEKASGATLVHLDRAMSPAPSWAALGWLETSIRSYAKFVDVAAKTTASHDGEAAVWKHKRVSIEEVRDLLKEMMEDDV